MDEKTLDNNITVFRMKFEPKNKYCSTCNRETTHAFHGYTKEGTLWKGHVCVCTEIVCTEHKEKLGDNCCR